MHPFKKLDIFGMKCNYLPIFFKHTAAKLNYYYWLIVSSNKHHLNLKTIEQLPNIRQLFFSIQQHNRIVSIEYNLFKTKSAELIYNYCNKFLSTTRVVLNISWICPGLGVNKLNRFLCVFYLFTIDNKH